MGVGKTHKIIEACKELPQKSMVYYIVGRIKLADELVDRMFKHGDGKLFATRKPYCGFADKVNIRVIVINSLMKYEHEEMDYLIIDESETTFGNLGMDGTDKQIWDRLVTLYSQSKKTTLLDALPAMPFIYVFGCDHERYRKGSKLCQSYQTQQH